MRFIFIGIYFISKIFFKKKIFKSKMYLYLEILKKHNKNKFDQN